MLCGRPLKHNQIPRAGSHPSLNEIGSGRELHGQLSAHDCDREFGYVLENNKKRGRYWQLTASVYSPSNAMLGHGLYSQYLHGDCDRLKGFALFIQFISFLQIVVWFIDGLKPIWQFRLYSYRI